MPQRSAAQHVTVPVHGSEARSLTPRCDIAGGRRVCALLAVLMAAGYVACGAHAAWRQEQLGTWRTYAITFQHLVIFKAVGR